MQSHNSRVLPQMQQFDLQQSRGDSQLMHHVRPYFTPEQYQQVIQMLNKSPADGSSTSTTAAGPLHWTGEGDW
uniref:Putative ovule protein n=1 Tax=Solanum chacoense TaxID=4108 RepID=A0A0V0GL47_SOLCH